MSDSPFSIQPITEQNVAHVASVFRAIYGDDFPVSYVYDPELLMAEVAGERLAAALATDAEGKPAGYVSCYKCAPNPWLWEGGNLIVVPEYSDSSLALSLANHFLQPGNLASGRSDGIFDEAVCHHYFTQVSCAKAGMVGCALALDQLDGTSFKQHRPDTSRVACLMQFLELSDPELPCHLPRRYFDILSRLLESLRPRRLLAKDMPLPDTGVTQHHDDWYAAARTWRISVSRVGGDWEEYLDAIVGLAHERHAVSLQIVLSTDLPYIDAAVEAMRQRQFFLGGVFPRWFGADGVMLQQVLGKEPDYDGIRLYEPLARELLKFIEADRDSVVAHETRM